MMALNQNNHNPLASHLPTIQKVLLYCDPKSMRRIVELSAVTPSWHELLLHHSYPLLVAMQSRFPRGPQSWLTQAAGADIDWLCEAFLHLKNCNPSPALLQASATGSLRAVNTLLNARELPQDDCNEQDEFEKMWAESWNRLWKRENKARKLEDRTKDLEDHVKDDHHDDDDDDDHHEDEREDEEKSSMHNRREQQQQQQHEEERDFIFTPNKLFHVADKAGTTPLMHAASSNNVAVVQAIYRRCPGALMTSDTQNRNVLHFAGPDALRWLIKESGATIPQLRQLATSASDRVEHASAIPLHLHASRSHFAYLDRDNFESCALLLDLAPRSSLTPNAKKMTVLHMASRAGNAGLVRLLCSQYNADPLVETCNASPVYLAASAGHGPCVDELCRAGAKLHRLFMVSCITRNWPMMDLLLERRVPILGSGGMHEVARRHFPDAIRRILTAAKREYETAATAAPAAAGESNNNDSDGGNSGSGSVEKVPSSYSSKIPTVTEIVNEISLVTGTAPLHEAVIQIVAQIEESGRSDTDAQATIAELMRADGADINVRTAHGKETVLHILAKCRSCPPMVVQMLLDLNADLTLVDARGKTAEEVAGEVAGGGGASFLSALRVQQLSDMNFS